MDTGAGEIGPTGDDVDTHGREAGVDAPDDAVETPCTSTVVSGEWEILYGNGKSGEEVWEAAYQAAIGQSVEGFEEALVIRFYREFDPPFPDTGTFDLSTGDAADTGTCSHCVVVRGPSPSRRLAPDRGTLVVGGYPHHRVLDVQVSDLRLVEWEFDSATQRWTRVPGGLCLETADFAGGGAFPPDRWSCSADRYADGQGCECDCGGPADPDCYEGLPVSDCDATEVCGFDRAVPGRSCIEVCDWGARDGCDAGTCTPSIGRHPVDTCSEYAPGFDEAEIGETCEGPGFQQFCHVVDGFALGYCDELDACKPVCARDEDCTEGSETCRRFDGEDGYGYCGTGEPSEDG